VTGVQTCALPISTVAPGVASAAPPQVAQTRAQGADTAGTGAILLNDKLAELITTTGNATITVPPDGVRISLGVEVQNKTAAQARNELARKTQNVKHALDALGQKGLVLQTALLQIEPVYSQPQAGRAPKILGYRAQNTLTLTLKEVSLQELGNRAASLVDASVNAGANVVQGVSFFLTRADEAQARALKLAVVDAEKNAKTMASSLGLAVVKLHSIEGSPEGSGQILRSALLLEKSADSTSIEPGEIRLSASVTARFHFSKE